MRLCAVVLVLVGVATGRAAQSPEVESGLVWLDAQVQANGALEGESASVARPVQAATDVLHTLSVLKAVSQPLAQRVAVNSDTSTESLARSAIALSHAGLSPANFIVTLLKRRNPDGGFGDELGSPSNPLDTAWTLLAFRVAGFSDAPTLKAALDYLASKGRSDGGYAVPGESNSVYATSYALQALVAYRDAYPLSPYVSKSIGWLQGARGGSGSYGSPLYDALATIALSAATTDATQYAPLLAALRAAQASDGSWSADPFLTSLALRALSGQGQPPPSVAQGRVAARVIDAASRRPLPGSSIAIAGLGLSTNAEGRFETAGINPGTYPLSVMRAGYLSAQQEVTVAAAVVNNLGDIELALPADGALLHGSVYDGDSGQPLQGAGVQVNSGGSLFNAVTAVGGTFEIGGIPASTITVTVQKAGYRGVAAGMQVSGGASYGFSPALYSESGETPVKATLKGRVADSGSGQAIAGAQVGAGGKSAISGADGRFAIADLEPGSAQLSVAADGYQPAGFNTVLTPGDNQAGDLALKSASSSMTIFGKVFRYGTSTGIPGAVVRVQGSSRQAVANAQGDYRIEGLAEKHLTLIVSAPGHYTQTYPFNAGELGSFRLNLQLTKAEDKGLRLAVSTDQPAYDPFSSVEIAVTVTNEQNQQRPVVLTTLVYDSEHNLLHTIPFKLLALGNSIAEASYLVPAQASIDAASKWYTESTRAGDYTLVVSAAAPGGEILAEVVTGVTVRPKVSIGGGIVLNPPITQAGTSEAVSIQALVGNRGNLAYPGGPVRLSVVLERPDSSLPAMAPATIEPLLRGSPLNKPRGIVVDRAGNLFTANSSNRKIIKMAPDGTVKELATLDLSHTPSDVALMPDNSLRVLTTAGMVVPVDASGEDGTAVRALPSGDLSGLAIAADEAGNLFVAVLQDADRVLVRLGAGGGTTELLRNGLESPRGIAAGADGKIYVSSSSGHAIVRIDSAGRIENFVTTGLDNPTGLVAAPSGGFFVADSGNDRVLRVGVDGSLLPFATGIASPQEMAVDATGNLVVVRGDSSIVRVSDAGTVGTILQSIGASPSGLAYSADGRLYVSGAKGGLRRVAANGQIETLLPDGKLGTAVSDLVFGGDAALYSVEGGDKILRNEIGSASVTTHAGGLNGASGLAVDAGGSLLVAEKIGSRITRVNSSGAKETLARPLLDGAAGIVAAADGTRYVLGSAGVSRISPAGIGELLADDLGGTGNDIALNPSGGVYVLVGGTKLVAVSDTGATVLRATVPDSRRIAVAADGSVYLVAQSGKTIHRLAPDNVQSTFAALPFQVMDLDTHPEGGLVVGLMDGFLYRVSSAGTYLKGSSIGILTALAVAEDGSSHALLSDGKLVRVDGAGQKSTLLSGPASPKGLARLADGSYDIVHASLLRQYGVDNQLRQTLASFGSPLDVEWMDGAVVFCDSSHGRVYKLVPGEGIPRLLANVRVDQLRYDNGKLYGIVGGSRQVVHIAANGAVTEYYRANSPGSFKAIAVRGGDIAIANSDHQVLVIGEGSALKAMYTAIISPDSLAVDTSNRVLVATDVGVVRFSADGLQSELLPLTNAKGLAIAADGSLWASSNRQVSRYVDGRFETVGTASSTLGSIAFLDGRLYAADASRLRRLSGSSLVDFAQGIDSPDAMRVGPDGALYMAGTGGTIMRYDGGLKLLLSGYPILSSLAFRPDGLYFSDSEEMYHLDVSSGVVRSQGLQPLLVNSYLQGIAVDPHQRILAVGSEASTVFRIEPSYPIPSLPPGTEVHSIDAVLPPILANGTPHSLELGNWVPPYAGDYRLQLTSADGVARPDLANNLHVGPHVGGSLSADRGSVAPGNAALRLNVGVEGVDFTTASQVDPANTRQILEQVRPSAMGADPAGNIYLSSTTKIVRVKPDGTRSDVLNASGYTLTLYGHLPVDPQSNLYTANSLKQLLRIAPDGAVEVFLTLSAEVRNMAMDSRGDLVVMLKDNTVHRIDHLTRQKTQVYVGPRTLYSLTIDGHDNLYVVDYSSIVTKFLPSGASSVVSGEIQFEKEQNGPTIAGDCADNLIVAPFYWAGLANGPEEHTLVQISGKSGKPTKIFDGTSQSPVLGDMDFIVYDRYGQSLLVWSDKEYGDLSTSVSRIYRMPIRCGSLGTDLHVIVPAGQSLGGFDTAPSGVVTNTDGSSEYTWSLEGERQLSRMLQFDTMLPGMKLGDERSVVAEAFLLFRNSFTGNSIKLPLQVPKIIAGATTVSMSLATGQPSYPPEAAVDIALTLQASGPSVQGRVRLDLFDAGGELVQTLIDENHSVASGFPLALNPPLNTGSYQAGAYQLKASFMDEAGNLQAKADASFAIGASGGDPASESAIKVVPTTGKAAYGEFDAVDLLVRARSQASNFNYDKVTLKLTVLNPQGMPVHSDSRVIAQLRPGAMVELPGRYQLPGAVLGAYTLRAEMLQADGKVLAHGKVNFDVREDDAAKLSGSVLVGTKSPYVGDAQSCRDTIVNGGTRALNALPLRRRIVELAGNRQVSEEITQLTVQAGTSQQLDRSFSTEGFGPGTHACVLDAEINGQWKTLGYDTFSLQKVPVRLSGSVVANIKPVPRGETQTCHYNARNDGPRALAALPLRRSVVRLSPEQGISETTVAQTMPAGGQQTQTDVFSTDALELGPHACVLEAQVNGQWQTLGQDTFTVDPPPIRLSGELKAGDKGRLLVLLDGPAHGSQGGPLCHNGLFDLLLEADFDPALSPDAVVEVKLLDRYGLLIDVESTSLLTFNGEINGRKGSRGIDLVIPSFSAGELVIGLTGSTGQQLIDGSYQIVAKVGAATRVLNLSTGLISLGCNTVHAVGDTIGQVFKVLGFNHSLHAGEGIGDGKDRVAAAAQRQYLDALLRGEGWSYKIVTGKTDFATELRSGAYQNYALLSEYVVLDEQLQKELREAVNRGEGLLAAGRHDVRRRILDQPLGITYSGTHLNPASIEMLPDSPLGNGQASFGSGNDVQRIKLSGASKHGKLISGVPTAQDSTVTVNPYGKGKSALGSFDLLGEASMASSGSLFRELIGKSLVQVNPPQGSPQTGRTVPLKLHIDNDGNRASVVAKVSVSSGGYIVDAKAGTVAAGKLDWSFELEAGKGADNQLWVRLPPGGLPVTVSAKLTAASGTQTADAGTITIELTPPLQPSLDDALSALAVYAATKSTPGGLFGNLLGLVFDTRHPAKKALDHLKAAHRALDSGDTAKALSELVRTTDELIHDGSAQIVPIRQQVDEAIFETGQLQ